MCVPGWQLCRNCLTKLEHLEKDNVMTESHDKEPMDFGETDLESSFSRFESTEAINESLEVLGESPKLHSVPKHHRLAYANSKFEATVTSFKQSFAAAVGVQKEKKMEPEAPHLSRIVMTKANDFDKLMEQISDKLSTVSSREKVQLLTLTPESWSIKEASSYFQVSEYFVKHARELETEQGILACPGKKKGKELPSRTIEAVNSFFEDDEFSRIMPGKKDFVSISHNTHKQKRLLLCNLKELYATFVSQQPDIKIGFSKFCSLRPKWCITVDSKGSHSVCVCVTHQNAILLVDAIDLDQTYKDLIDIIVCDRDSKTCMIHRCDDCPGTQYLQNFDSETLTSADEEIFFQQWQSTDSSKLLSQTLDLESFIDLVVKTIDRLTSHSYLAKNYSFVVQDEVQSYHWSKPCCTLHPLVVYFKEDETLMQNSFCILSDDLEHDTSLVYQIQKELTQVIKTKLPKICKLEYFSDGCASQYKNYIQKFLELDTPSARFWVICKLDILCIKSWQVPLRWHRRSS